jgi:hypothetical protein
MTWLFAKIRARCLHSAHRSTHRARRSVAGGCPPADGEIFCGVCSMRSEFFTAAAHAGVKSAKRPQRKSVMDAYAAQREQNLNADFIVAPCRTDPPARAAVRDRPRMSTPNAFHEKGCWKIRGATVKAGERYCFGIQRSAAGNSFVRRCWLIVMPPYRPLVSA